MSQKNSKLTEFSVVLLIHGHVQGVYFRAFIENHARQLGIAGFVKNLPSGSDLEVQAEGEEQNLRQFIEYLKIGPPSAIVENIELKWGKSTGEYSGFCIRY